MASERNYILIETVKRLLRRGAHARLKKIISRIHAADLSMVFSSLSASHQRQLFSLIEDRQQQGKILSELDEDIVLSVIEGVSVSDIIEILDQMPSDDAAAFIKLLPREQADDVLAHIRKKGDEDVENLLMYPDDTAGGIMIPDFIALPEDMTAGEVVSTLQSKEYKDIEMPFYIYVIDEDQHLSGVCSLRQLVLVRPDTPLKNFMSTDVISVTTDMDQEEVAKIVARYNFLAVPVVDEEHRMVGLVTVDDVIDIFREEATEDILKMAGVGEEFVETKSVFRSTRIRLPWLFASCVGGVIAIFVIGHFEASLQQISYLAAFIPVIMGMGGNVGIQSSTIVVRGLATGRIHIQDLWRVVSKELAVGLILGVVYGCLLAGLAQFQYSVAGFSLAVSMGVLSSMTVAALIGSLLPMLFARINVDPAVATGPFVTSAIDIVSVFFYFQLATFLLGI
ncbi:magnesium transporter [Desulfosalsimonas propionicica]|uniref:Magnesium transporter MgtE n=1 Tax=Desulfosalsimonas propionicica TaxID=332175 RepID=A0A7W0C9K1_9BACT|nr:magnesium transporter [Desulfosalsimonas propionicica]MBA2881685.1 magnesium transporter [Desulfosalsimonas propionicica]